MIIAIVIGLFSAAMLLLSGYLMGAKRGLQKRQRLHQQNRIFRQQTHIHREELKYLRRQLNAQQRHNELSENDVAKKIEALLTQGDKLRQMVEPLVQRDTDIQNLYVAVQQTLSGLSLQKQTDFDLSNLTVNSKHRSELTHLLDQIAEKAHLATVVLSDDAGLPLATNSNAKQTDRLTAISSLLLLLSERISRHDAPALLSVVIYDEAETQTLCRVFEVNKQKLFLIAQSIGGYLTPMALDGALPKVDSVLSP